jgi:hypothetical protein|tara:strand:+ start:570 stop:794 length:225 start_codon:yes stop_codon:yes gene_type:complete
MELIQNNVICLIHKQLIMLQQPGVILLLDEVLDFLVRKIDSEIHVAKEAFVIDVALLLGVANAEIIESFVINLS